LIRDVRRRRGVRTENATIGSSQGEATDLTVAIAGRDIKPNLVVFAGAVLLWVFNSLGNVIRGTRAIWPYRRSSCALAR
jgi:hypothetical protein